MIYQNSKSIAILLAVYNGEKYLAEQICSLIDQTNHDWTLYIRDDLSKDNTRSIIEEYCVKYDNIIELIDTKGNLGCRDNFFTLLEAVKSDYYMFCDADDVWLPEKIEISINKVRSLETMHPSKPILVHTDTSIHGANMELIAPSNWKLKGLNPDIFTTTELFPIYPCVGGATMLFNRLAYNVCVPIKPTFRMYDPYVAVNVIKSGVVEAIKIPLLKYRQHSNNLYGAFDGEKNEKRTKWNSLKKKIGQNMMFYRMLYKEKYGSIFKYIYYKLIIMRKISKMRKDLLSTL